MTIKMKAFILTIILVFTILCISGLVYAASSRHYNQKKHGGTFVYYESMIRDC